MRTIKHQAVNLLLFLFIAFSLPIFASAEDGISILEEQVEEDIGIIVLIDEDDDISITDEDIMPFSYQLDTFDPPGNIIWENGRLLLNINWALIQEVGVQHGGQACACFSLAYCRTIIDGVAYSYSDFSLGTTEEDAYASWSLAAYEGYYPTDKQSAYERIFFELCQGKPVVVRVEGQYTSLHYVTIIGFENVADGLDLSAYNFLILDPGTPGFEIENMGYKGFDLKKDSGTYQVECDASSNAASYVRISSEHTKQQDSTFSQILRAFSSLSATIERKMCFMMKRILDAINSGKNQTVF